MLTVKEYVIQRRPFVTVGIPDGWKPLTPRLDPGGGGASGSIILPCIVDTEAPECAEVIRLIPAGWDISKATEGLDAAPLGYVDGVYLFLDLQPEDTSPVRRVTHPALAPEMTKEEIQAALRRSGLDKPQD